ncbi:hypothetical protein Hanom_Chr09g00815961 [Helianthus anomalus]
MESKRAKRIENDRNKVEIEHVEALLLYLRTMLLTCSLAPTLRAYETYFTHIWPSITPIRVLNPAT